MKRMNWLKHLVLTSTFVMIPLATPVLLTGCEEGPAEEMGEEIDDAADEMEDAADEIAE